MDAETIALTLARNIDFQRNLIVPNISHGFVSWGEMDLLVVSASGYLTEYEIKISIADLKREWGKKRWTNPMSRERFTRRIKFYYIAIPAKLGDRARECIPEDIGAGLALVSEGIVTRVIPARANPARPVTDRERCQVARLGTIRYWARRARPPPDLIKNES